MGRRWSSRGDVSVDAESHLLSLLDGAATRTIAHRISRVVAHGATQACTNWTTLDEQVANFHLDLAIQDADSVDEVRINLEVLRITGAMVTRAFRRAYDDLLNAPFGARECCACSTPEATQEYADYSYWKRHEDFDDED